MKSKISIAIILLVLAAATSCNFFCENGNGKLVTKNIEVTKFDEIEISGKSKVFIEQGAEPQVTIKADSNLVDLIKFEISGSKLRIFESKCIDKFTELEIHITSTNLKLLDIEDEVIVKGNNTIITEDIHLKAYGSAVLDLSLNAENIKIDANGNSALKLAGRAMDLDIEILNNSQLEAYDLIVKEAEVYLNETTLCKLSVSDKIDGDVNDFAKLYYRGNPKKIQTNQNDEAIIKAE